MRRFFDFVKGKAPQGIVAPCLQILIFLFTSPPYGRCNILLKRLRHFARKVGHTLHLEGIGKVMQAP